MKSNAIGLNDAQQQAVEQGDGPTLVLAGAGTGKTRVIVERIVWLINERGVDPRNILALTFTNKAGGEMRSRVASRLGAERLAAWIGTFHAFGLTMLRREMTRLGRPATFSIFDDADQLALIKRQIRELPKEFDRVSPRAALEWISRRKQALNGPPQPSEAGTPEEVTFSELWTRYHAALKRAAGVDFDDLLVLPAKLLEQDEEVRARYRRRYRYVLVDEYQDTNHAQYRIAHCLAAEHGNLFVVGDEDQSIYSWRGADLRNILDFEEDFPNATVIRLEENYRSTFAILNAANSLVAHNVNRLGKTLRPAKPGGAAVRLYHAPDGEDEARFVAEDITARELPSRDVAILFRTHAQSRLLEEAMRRKGLAYVIVGGIAFYARKEIKDVLCYLRLLVNPADDEALRRILNVPPRGFGAKTVEQIEEYAKARGASLLTVLHDLEGDQTVRPLARDSAAKFVHLIDDLALAAETAPVADLVRNLLEVTEYRAYVQADDAKTFRDRLEIVDEFISACAHFDENGGAGLAAFLQDLALQTDSDGWDPESPAVTLMTCHNAKGLEFDHVFLVGLEEGLLPHGSALDSDLEIEEERRLCYVAMTRARETLTLTAAQARTMYGEYRDREPSRFLDEIPTNRIALVGGAKEAQAPAPTPRPAVPKADSGQLKTGTRVRHARFGPGTVLYTKGTGKKLRARIRFQTGRVRDFSVANTPLEIIAGEGR